MGPPTPVAGTVAGHAFNAQDAIATTGTVNSSTRMDYSISVVVTAWANACSQSKANASLLSIQLGGTGSLGAGSYDITDTTHVQVSFVTQDSNCNAIAQSTAQSGSVAIETANSTQVAGSVNAVFAGGARLTGSFTAPLCNASNIPSCQP